MKSKSLVLGIWLMSLVNLSSVAQTVFINEIHYDNSGADVNEAIEIVGSAGTDLVNWTLVLYNGNNGVPYHTQNLSGILADVANGFGFQTINYPTNGIQNGAPDGIALIDNNGTVIQFLSYEGSFIATGGPANGKTSVDIGVSETGATVPGQSLQLTGAGSIYEDFTWASPETSTFNEVNNNQVFDTTSGGLVFIHEVQGSGNTSPMVGQTVTVEGIVVGDFQATAKGFYLQEEDGDSDSLLTTSEGIFIYAPATIDVSIGDKVKITGTVTEYFGLTEINNVADISIISTGNPLPSIVTITLPHASANYLERYEGMYVQYNQELVVTNNYLLGRGGELEVSYGNRLYQSTQVATPGTAAIAKELENSLNSIIIDDASIVQNPDPVIFPSPGMNFNNFVRGGCTVTNVKGVITYGWSGFNLGSTSTSAYRVYVTEDPVFNSSSNPRLSVPESVGGTLKIASFNVLNYFNGDGKGNGFPTSRGADNVSEFNRQRDKIVNAIAVMQADIIGLMEIENDGYRSFSAIQDLVNGLNNVGTESYAFVNPGVSQIGTDEIAVGFIYNTATVSLQGSASILDSSVDPLFDTNKNRPALAQSFKEIASDEIITVCVNHFKSKGSDCNDLGDPDMGDGQGNCNITRKNAATALVNWLATDPTNSGSTYKMIIGDFNAYAKEDPITVIERNGYINLLQSKQGVNGYSYSFSGRWGTLDYVFSDSTLGSFVTGVTAWHINADEATVLDYNEEFKSAGQITSFYSTDAHRASDHDPIIVGIEFPTTTFKFETGFLHNVGSDWKTVGLSKNYQSMVVVTSVVLPDGLMSKPAVTRIKNAVGNSFDVKVQNPSRLPLTGYDVYYIVVEEGVYNLEEDGINMEAVKVNSSVTAGKGAWVREKRNFFNSYTSPVVLGQVMTNNNEEWSVFWASAKNKRKLVPHNNSFACGKHVGEDYLRTRKTEVIGYIVIEAGTGILGNKAYMAKVGSNTIMGVQNNPIGYHYDIEGLSTAEVALVSSAAMKGNNGGWPVLAGAYGLTVSQLSINIDEDQIKDRERKHNTEQVAYLVIGTPAESKNICAEDKSLTTGEAKKMDEHNEVVINVFPNPAQNQVTIASNNVSGKGTVTISTLTDTLVKQIKFNAKNGINQQVDLSGLTNGIYLVNVKHDAGVNITKLILNR